MTSRKTRRGKRIVFTLPPAKTTGWSGVEPPLPPYYVTPPTTLPERFGWRIPSTYRR